jgi:serine phosphatase RsbU (regulator of sigma subunit)
MKAKFTQFVQYVRSRSQSRLSQKIVFWLFVSIVGIEAIILIPSVIRRQQELLSQIKGVSEAKVALLAQLTPQQATAKNLIAQLARLQDHPNQLMGKLEHAIVGGAFYLPDGQLIGTFGEVPDSSLSQLQKTDARYLDSGDRLRYEIMLKWMVRGKEYNLILRHDVTSVRSELIAFQLRIAGLVAIIAVFTTVGTWIAIEQIVITPILRLRGDLLKAGEAICRDREPPKFYCTSAKRRDELGDVIAAFCKMFGQIQEAIRVRKQTEVSLQDYSQALDRELETGREMQQNFLPAQLMQISGWEIAAFFKPARRVAGDFYDTFEIRPDAVGLVIADVCDKGVGAALFMALFRSLLRAFAAQIKLQGQVSAILDAHQPLSGWLGESATTNLTHLNILLTISLINDYVTQNHGDLGMFATLFFGVLDPATGLLTYINAGHEPPLILSSSGGVRVRLKGTGPAVGMLPATQFQICQIYLEPNEILFGYTDGVSEARAKDGEFFSEKRLLSLLDSPTVSATALIDRIAVSVSTHVDTAEQFDDITMLAVQRVS